MATTCSNKYIKWTYHYGGGWCETWSLFYRARKIDIAVIGCVLTLLEAQSPDHEFSVTYEHVSFEDASALVKRSKDDSFCDGHSWGDNYELIDLMAIRVFMECFYRLASKKGFNIDNLPEWQQFLIKRYTPVYDHLIDLDKCVLPLDEGNIKKYDLENLLAKYVKEHQIHLYSVHKINKPL